MVSRWTGSKNPSWTQGRFAGSNPWLGEGCAFPGPQLRGTGCTRLVAHMNIRDLPPRPPALKRKPAHRDKAAMNGAQLLMAQ
jgi:hypothetical protein